MVWSPPPPAPHITAFVKGDPTKLASFLVSKCSKFFLACTFVLAIPLWVWTFSCGWSHPSASNLLNRHLRISDHSFQSSVPKHNFLILDIIMFLSSIVLTHCANTLSYFFFLLSVSSQWNISFYGQSPCSYIIVTSFKARHRADAQ